MADMKHAIESGKNPDAGHVYPIMLAYGLADTCIPGSTIELADQFLTEPFRYWYDELRETSTQVHPIFVAKLNKLIAQKLKPEEIQYPLELYKPMPPQENNNYNGTTIEHVPAEPVVNEHGFQQVQSKKETKRSKQSKKRKTRRNLSSTRTPISHH